MKKNFAFEMERTDRKKKVIALLGLNIVVTPYTAYLFYQILENFLDYSFWSGKITLNFNYFLAWYYLLIKRDEIMVSCWGLMEIICIGTALYVLMRPKAKLGSVKEYQVTDSISIPVPCGNGQHGKSWFASKQDENRLLKTISIKRNDDMKELKERPGMVVSMEREGEVDKIRCLNSFAHSIILALTGAGKTRRVLLEAICLQLMAGDCILVSDVKGEIYYYTSDYAKKRAYQVVAIDLINPLKSAHYNFLQPIIDALKVGRKKHESRMIKIRNQMEQEEDLEQIGALAKELELLENDYSWTDEAQDYAWDLVAIFAGEQKGEPLWFNGETATLAASIMALCLEAPKECWNLYNAYNFIAYMSQAHPVTHKTPLAAYLNQLPDAHPAKMIYMQAQVAEERTRASFNTSALGTLRLFTNPQLAEMSSKSDFSLSDIGKKKIAIYMIIPDEKKTRYPIASVLINQLYIAQVKTARENGGTLKIPTDYDLDEVGNFPTIPVMQSLVAVGRSRGIRANLVIQDYQQMQAKYEKEFETIKTQCGLKIFLKSDNGKTLEEISKKLGDYTVESTAASASSGENESKINVSNSSNMGGRRLLFESDLSKIKAPYALVMVTGEDPMITKLPDLSAYHFNEMLGLGDEKHNQKLIARKEAERKERDYKPLPLWGIWNEYKAMLEEEAKKMVSNSGIPF